MSAVGDARKRRQMSPQNADAPAWVQTLARWADSPGSVLDFGGDPVPDAMQRLLERAHFAKTNEALLRDATVRLDEQRKMTDEAEERAEQTKRDWDAEVSQAEDRIRQVERVKDTLINDVGFHQRRADRAEAENADLRATIAAVRTFADELDAGASLRWTGDVAKELRGVLGGGST